MDVMCPCCNLLVSGEGEKEVKDQLKRHLQELHKVNEADFESMFSELRTLSTLFVPPGSKSR